ncbi:phosphonopyruvate decarboxylase [Cohnella nanjingensis]|uniref:Phosphonopyruvate decarboxylase n=1 Tax=Cohnella nanjingensis TaxID=1387779 RepID=A0A7X0RLQ3_9BACL|nr:phosphonopyruvate decarboxylase [Cohnella nanjingensis]MBB6669651.1 phosphonopyruvate decarboxylase [Cohnella nanjingensis]
MDAGLFGKTLKKMGFTFFSGVPCSYLKSLINYAINECDYVAAANEGEAVAIASGASIGGKKPVVLMQNSGLTNAVSPLTSLTYPFQIPLLGFVSLRGEPGMPDEPQHMLMGRITTQLLELMQVEWQYLSNHVEEAARQVIQAADCISKGRSFFFVVKKDTFKDEPLRKQHAAVHSNRDKRKRHANIQMPTRFAALKAINALKDCHTVQLATTGKTGRELYEIEDAENNLYMVGSMGCISSLGLGLALSQPKKDIVVIDGDGSLLMRMGSLATNGYYHPPNMVHILLDNNAHESTGGQSTVSHHIDFIEIAASCGYAKSLYTHSLEELEASLKEWKQSKGLTFIYLKIDKQSKDQLTRPHIKPHEVKKRLHAFINNP